MRPTIVTKRVYEPPDPSDGKRILIDRLWPRGISREKAKIDMWAREIAPTHQLRKWYQHDPAKWEEFRSRYFAELTNNQEQVQKVIDSMINDKVTLLFSSKEENLNNARALREFFEAI